ncbi:MAG: ATP-binding protein, partial [Campylobacterota bacterium]|nr:ATP-binding protein [Campylobacterota bacterium]
TYKQIKQKYNIRQLHFHLPNSDSFLRMHRPNKFGDSLIGIRQSVEYVNKYLKPYSGFEEGRIFNGYRYIFPLSYDTEHIGSVEISFDFYSFMDNYFNVFNSKRVNFLLSKEIIDKKVFEKEQSNYIASPIEGYYFDKGVLKKLDKLQRKVIPSNKNQEKFDYISKNIPKGNPFVVHFYEVEELSVVIPLLNELSSEVVGAITISKSDAYITQKRDEFRQLLLIILVILLFLMIFIYRELISKFNTKFESQRNQKILDSQNSFILITDGFEIKASNRSMLDFFGFETLEQFKKVSSCICDYFQKEEAIEYIQKEMEGVNWFEYIKNNMHENLKIKMNDKNNDPHIFAIEFSKFEGVDYIVSFLDITKVENANIKLKNMEVQLVQSEKLASLGNMIGNIAHQWRQPLSVISTSASGVLVKKEYGVLEDKDLSDYMNNIMLNVNFLSDTIDTFRDFIKEDKEIKKINIQENIDIILKILAASLENNHIKLIKNIDYSKPIIKSMVSGELSQVISNLVNNAKDILVEKNIDNPQIKIVCKVVNNSIFITIQDNAGGVPEDIINKIFEPYFTTKHQSQGTGLGLYMSYKIVTESLNGKLYVKNENGGANFIIELSL